MTWPGLWPGVKRTSISSPASSRVLAAVDGVVGVVAFVRADAGPRHVGHDVGEDRHLDFRAVDRCSGRPGDRRDRPDVIEVAVGEQDRFERRGRARPAAASAGRLRRRDRSCSALPVPSLQTRYEFSATGPTVVPMTSRPAMFSPGSWRGSVRVRGDARAPGPCNSRPGCRRPASAGRSAATDRDRAAEEQDQQDDEDDRGDQAPEEGALPGRRIVTLGDAAAASAAGLRLIPRLGPVTGPRLAVVSMLPAWVPRFLRLRFFFV